MSYIEICQNDDPESRYELGINWYVFLMDGGQPPEPSDVIEQLGDFETLDEARAFAAKMAVERGLEVFEVDLGGGYPPAVWGTTVTWDI